MKRRWWAWRPSLYRDALLSPDTRDNNEYPRVVKIRERDKVGIEELQSELIMLWMIVT